MKLPPGYVPGVGVVAPTARGGFGERLLRRLGWADGEGLGKDGQGRADAVTVTKKADLAGVSWEGVGAGAGGGACAAASGGAAAGPTPTSTSHPRLPSLSPFQIGVDPAAPTVDWADKWWEGAYAKAAAGVKTDTAGRASTSTSSSSGGDGGGGGSETPSSSSSPDDDDDDPDHAARLAEAVGAPAPAPAPRVRRRRLNGDGTAATGSAAELAIAAAATSSRSTPRGGATFGGRAGKLARLRAQEAELGGAARERLLHGRGDAGARTAGSAAVLQQPPVEAEGSKKARPPPLRAPPTPPPQPQLGPAPTPPQAGWWGAGRFIWAGPLGGVGAEKAAALAGTADAKTARGFIEADQEGLVDRAEAGKSSWRRGLGAKKGGGGSGGGPAWEGKKTTFDEGEDGEEGGEVPALPAPPPTAASLPKKWRAAAAAVLGGAAKGRLASGDLAASLRADPAALAVAVAASSRFMVDKKGRVSLAVTTTTVDNDTDTQQADTQEKKKKKRKGGAA